MPSLHDITSLMKDPSAEELALVERAYAFAEAAHQSHKRYSSEPYFMHLVETAKIVAELDAGAAAIAAGLLHDTLEDAGIAQETLRKEFGSEILMLVDGVTKLGHIHYRGVDRYSESMRRLFIASAKDLRVLIVKLADRLHNMRTLSHVPKEKQERIAKETLEIYAPLAYRLGIRKINRELEELAFPFAYGAEYGRVKALLHTKHGELTRRLEKFHRSVLKTLSKQGVAFQSSSHRIKGLYSLYLKLRQKEWDIEKIFDVLAVRVLVGTVEDCYRVLGLVHSVWRPLPGRIKDYIAFPKPNGYRSLHTTVFTGDDGFVELQIRTGEMHRESEYGIAAQFEYKELEQRKTRPDALSWAKRLLSALVSWRAKSAADEKDTIGRNGNGVPMWVQELGEVNATAEEAEFWTHLRNDFFKNRVFVFTPKGDVVDLPADSSPIDFAYAIHSDIGDHLTGANVNGKLVAIHTPLHNGDVVHIQTKQSARPSQKWLDVAKTALAKKHIRNALTKLGVRS